MRTWLLIGLLLFVTTITAQKTTQEEYVKLYADMAVRKMYEYGIPASITLAQGILESGSGNSALAKNAKNHFGIKCHTGWEGEGYYMTDDAPDECFRVYESVEDSYKDHGLFLTSRVRYKFLFTDYDRDDYKGWAEGLKKAGYATNPKYPELLISIIERHGLQKYDHQDYPLDEHEEPVYAENNEELETEEGGLNFETQEKENYIYFNNIKTTVCKGESPFEIAITHDLPLDKLFKYNDLIPGSMFAEGDIVFLQPKRNNGTSKKHYVAKGETMWEISQTYGIKMKKLYKKNKMEFDEQPAPGQVIYMKKKRKTPPQTITYEESLNMKEKKKENVKPIEEKEVVTTEGIVKSQVKEKDLNKQQETKNEDSVKVFENATEKPKKPKTYMVKHGDTLYSLSNRFYVSVDELKRLNGLTDNVISIGQILVIQQDYD